MYDGMDSIVFVYGPAGPELDDYLERVESYNSRLAAPTSWKLKVYKGVDFLEKMLEDKPGNLVVLAGNNRNKTEYIKACIDAGLNVYSDKPMAIEPSDLPILQSAFKKAEEKGLLLYDIMTERFEITTLLQKKLSEQENIFGSLQKGSVEEPAITKESVHHFFKYVSGKALTRPAWFFDVEQEGQAIADVGTHLVDLILWEAFPEGIQDYRNEVEVLQSKKWATRLGPEEFEKVTGLTKYPDFLNKYIEGDSLNTISNSSVNYKIKDVYAKVSVEWDFQAPEGAGDTHYSIMRGSISDLIIHQGPEENYRPELYIRLSLLKHAELLQANILLYLNEELSEIFPGIALEIIEEGLWRLNIPNKYRNGHEAHFADLTRQFLYYMDEGKIPEWEIQQMITKYYSTILAVEKSE
jgi:predicted dehydrogenase